jgi:hypothetical protein
LLTQSSGVGRTIAHPGHAASRRGSMRKSTIILTIGLWLLAFTNMWLLMRLAEEHAAYAQLRAQRSPWNESAAIRHALTIENAPRDISTSTSGPPSHLTARPLPASRESADAAKAAQAFARTMNAERRVMNDPGYREAHKAQRRIELAGWRDDAIRLIGMTPEQADRALEIQIESEMAWLVPPPNPVTAEDMKQRMRDIEASNRQELARLSEFLGKDKAIRWEEYVESQPTRNEINRLRMQLLSSADPLREDQVESLISAVHAERSQFHQQMNDFYVSLDWSDMAGAQAEYARKADELTSMLRDNSRTAAAGILSQQQLAAYDAMLARQRELQQARTRLLRTQAQIKQAGTAAAP